MEPYQLKGGLDLRTGVAQVNPGTLQDCLNYEVAGVDGYTRIGGFERYDGQFRVAEYTALKLRGPVTGTFAVGEMVDLAGATAYVTKTDAAAVYLLIHSRDTYPKVFPVSVSGASGSIAATACDVLPSPEGRQSAINTARKALSDAARPLVGLVPGNPQTPVAGVFWFKNRLYAIRDYPMVWFESSNSWPFRVGDQVNFPGGVFTVIAVSYTSDNYLAGHMVVWPLREDGTPMTVLPEIGDLITHDVDGSGGALNGAMFGETPFGMMGSLSVGSSSAVVTATQAPTAAPTDEPALRTATSIAGLWKATSNGWETVDLKREAQFNAGTAAFGTFIENNLGVGASPLSTGAKFCTVGTLNGEDVTDDVNADDGTDAALSGEASDELHVTGFDFSAVPDTATILGIEVRIKRHADVDGKCKDAIVELVGLDGTSTNKARVVEWETTDTEAVYGSSGDTWGNENITPAILKSEDFGVRLVTQNVDDTPSGGIDYVKVTVSYRRRDAAVYAWTGTSDVDVNLVDVQLITGSWADGDAAGWLVVDIPDALWGPTISNGMELRTAPNGAGDMLGVIAGGDTPIRLPGWSDLQANQSRYQFLSSNFYGMADYRAVYGVSGASPAFTYDGTRWLWVRTPVDAKQDLPRHIARHGSSLVLGYYQGAYIVSVVGQPTNFRGEDGAASFEIGSRLTNIMNAMGDALLVTSQTATFALHGLTPDDYQQDTVSGNRGALEYTAADVGRLLVTDQIGVAAADATQAFGDLARTYISMQVEDWLKPRLQALSGAASTNLRMLCALPVRSKNQYRLYFRDGYVLTATANEPVEYTPQRYMLPGSGDEPDQAFPVACVGSGIDANGSERLFGSFDADANRGYVFELDHGNSFDGQPIPAYFTLNPLSFSDNTMLKRFDRLFLFGQAEGSAALSLSRRTGFEAPDGSKASRFAFGPPTANASGRPRPVRGEVDAPIEGYELSIRIDSNSDAEGPHTLQAISNAADARGTSRGHVRG